MLNRGFHGLMSGRPVPFVVRPVEDHDAWPALPRGLVRLIGFTAPAMAILLLVAGWAR